MEEIPEYPFMVSHPYIPIMAKIPRVEITDKALKVLKVETALSGLSQKIALEALILRGASSRTLAIVEEKPLMESNPQMEEKTKIPDKPHMECKTEGEAIICAPMQITPEARQALSFILGELQAGKEPTVNEIADKMGITTTGLGRILAACGIKAKNTHRDNKTVRIFTKPMKAQIEEILGRV